jgi:hypothetical protein
VGQAADVLDTRESPTVTNCSVCNPKRLGPVEGKKSNTKSATGQMIHQPE